MNMAHNDNTPDRFAAPYPSARVSEQVSSFVTAVYGWIARRLDATPLEMI